MKNIFAGRAGVGIDAKKRRSQCMIGGIGWLFLSRKRERAKSRKWGREGIG
jgi:predicted RNA-binding Zn ribbon-like protein